MFVQIRMHTHTHTDTHTHTHTQVMLGDLVGELLFTIQRHRLHLRGDIASTIVTMSLVEGLV